MRVFTSKQLAVLSLLLLMTCSFAWAQQQSKLDIALRFIEQNREKWDLTESDIIDMVVNDQYESDHNGVTHTYLIQRHASIEVYNAIMGVHITENGRVAHATNRFIPSLVDKINSTSPSISAYDAIGKAAAHLDLSIEQPLRLLRNENSHNFLYDGGNISHSKVKVKLAYQHMRNENTVRLAWNLAIDHPKTPDYWSIRVDALTGEILDKNNWTVYCELHEEDHVEHDGCNLDFAYEEEDTDLPTVEETLEEQNTNLMGGTYHVFPVPVESPIHGDRELVSDPADTTASPLGWHDVDGQEGAEYTITRGNNVHAFLDVDADNTSNGDEPDGGADLIFDFPFDDEGQEPNEYQPAAVTQLFYMNNMIHDFAYAYGFDEKAGNFQENNYGNGGFGNDAVNAHAQDGGGTNNANFGTPPDGQSGTMQMFLWDQAGGQLLQAIEPEEIARGFEVGTAGYGPAVSTTPVEGFVAEAFDGTLENPEYGCEAIVNGEDITGKVAMVDRGGCFFEQKTANVEAAGAIALIICNFEESPIGMAGVPEIDDPGIPTVSLKASDCALLRSVIDVGLFVSIGLPDDTGPNQIDGDFDNGIIAHEYGHGISNRLTGGPNAAGCLGNGEQMGEGWSDLMALFMSVKPGDTGEMPRGIGNYAIRAGVNGSGIRRQPYSTDMNLNTQTYADIVGQGVHATGEVWVDAVWDMYWAFVDAYGFDEDLINGSGGNNMAVQLFMDGMKLQPCNPGFVDGRDAILQADSILYDGVNGCLIWEAFARRGIGFSADQGDSFSNGDGVEGFDSKPQCIMELKIAKAVTPLIEAGDDITVNLTATNHKGEEVTNVVITDEIPAGLTYVAGSATGATATVNGNMLTLEVGAMANDTEVQISYQLSSDPQFMSLRTYFDDMEMGDDTWEFDALSGIDIWELSDVIPYSGEYSWYAPSTDNENDQVLQTFEPIMVSGNQPVLRFFHQYDSPAGLVGGLVQISTDGGTVWQNTADLMFRNAYPGPIEYFAFTIPNLNAFSGESNGYIPTYIDLSSFAGQEIKVRFRYGADDNGSTGALLGLGWFVDDFEMLDLINYNGEACITSEEGDMACTIAPEWGTIVESNGVVDVDDPEQKTVLAVYPNPANDFINVAITTDNAEDITLELLSLDGKVIRQKALRTNGDYQLIPMAVQDLSAGFYFVRVSTATEIAVEKIVIK